MSGALGLTALAVVFVLAVVLVEAPPPEEAPLEVLVPEELPQPRAPVPRARIAAPAARVERNFMVPPGGSLVIGGDAREARSAPAPAKVNAGSNLERALQQRIGGALRSSK